MQWDTSYTALHVLKELIFLNNIDYCLVYLQRQVFVSQLPTYYSQLCHAALTPLYLHIHYQLLQSTGNNMIDILLVVRASTTQLTGANFDFQGHTQRRQPLRVQPQIPRKVLRRFKLFHWKAVQCYSLQPLIGVGHAFTFKLQT